MSSDDGKPQGSTEQDLIRELASILSEGGSGDETPAAQAHPSASAKGAGSSSVDQSLIRELAALLTETGLTEIEVDQNGLRVRVARTAAVQSAPVPAVPVASQPAQTESAPSSPESHAGAVTSPMVGTAYLAPEPGADPFVKEGDSVRDGQTLMIVEAMKTMNPIPAPKSGKVTRIMVDDGQPVEYGEPLLIIE